MASFISLGHAARLLAADAPDELAFWKVSLIEQADALHMVKTWTEFLSAAPGGVSYLRAPEQWRIPLSSFKAWCAEHEHILPCDTPPAPDADKSADEKEGGRRTKQINKILEVVQSMALDAQCIPTGGKQAIKARCLTEAALFTDAAFARAWQAAVHAGYLRMENHAVYASRWGE